MTETLLRARALCKRFGDHLAVDNINFHLQRGECLGILGPNGAGKTTTLNMLLGRVIPTSGSLELMGFAIPEQARQARYKIGVVPQHNDLDPDFTVKENLVVFARYFGLRAKSLAARIDNLLQFAALEQQQDAKVTQLSGGMQRRLALARALIQGPELLILDEPTTGLDPQARQLLWQKLRQLKREGTSQILTTHYLEEAERLCDRILVIDSGQILAEGKPRTLIEQHIEAHVIEIRQFGHEHETQHFQADRLELVGDTLFCYCHNERDLLQQLNNSAVEYLHRPANLEDVFLKLTGRELRGTN